VVWVGTWRYLSPSIHFHLSVCFALEDMFRIPECLCWVLCLCFIEEAEVVYFLESGRWPVCCKMLTPHFFFLFLNYYCYLFLQCKPVTYYNCFLFQLQCLSLSLSLSFSLSLRPFLNILSLTNWHSFFLSLKSWHCINIYYSERKILEILKVLLKTFFFLPLLRRFLWLLS
jgi:hypothetical protein